MNLERSFKTTFCGIDIEGLELLGKGRQGRVYLLSEDRVIKIYKNKESCENQRIILQKSKGNRFFPELYEYDDYSVVMEFIKGIPMNRYLKFNSINKTIALGLVNLISEFQLLGFTRLDIRISHIFVQEDLSLRIIDPRGSFNIFQPYPNLMLRGLREFGAVESFFEFIRDDYADVYENWKSKWDEYNT